MKFRHTMLIGLVISIIISVVRNPHLPEVMAIHWGISGKPDGFGSKWFNLLFAPVCIVFIWAIFEATIKFTKPEGRESLNRSYKPLAAVLTLLFIGIQSLILFQPAQVSSSNGSKAFETGFGILMSLMLVGLGLSVRKIEPNPWAGIRVPWTMNNETVWRIVHERASKVWIVTGIIGVILSLVGVPFWLPLMLFVLISLWPLVDAYFVHKQVTKGTASS
jgi:uncharacterized membrane protein